MKWIVLAQHLAGFRVARRVDSSGTFDLLLVSPLFKFQAIRKPQLLKLSIKSSTCRQRAERATTILAPKLLFAKTWRHPRKNLGQKQGTRLAGYCSLLLNKSLPRDRGRHTSEIRKVLFSSSSGCTSTHTHTHTTHRLHLSEVSTELAIRVKHYYDKDIKTYQDSGCL